MLFKYIRDSISEELDPNEVTTPEDPVAWTDCGDAGEEGAEETTWTDCVDAGEEQAGDSTGTGGGDAGEEGAKETTWTDCRHHPPMISSLQHQRPKKLILLIHLIL